jgi:hypothetical protein
MAALVAGSVLVDAPAAEMARSPQVAARPLREGREFIAFLSRRDRGTLAWRDSDPGAPGERPWSWPPRSAGRRCRAWRPASRTGPLAGARICVAPKISSVDDASPPDDL